MPAVTVGLLTVHDAARLLRCLHACMPPAAEWVFPLLCQGNKRMVRFKKKAPWFPTRQICAAKTFCPTTDNTMTLLGNGTVRVAGALQWSASQSSDKYGKTES
jgi:hypothetical protein